MKPVKTVIHHLLQISLLVLLASCGQPSSETKSADPQVQKQKPEQTQSSPQIESQVTKSSQLNSLQDQAGAKITGIEQNLNAQGLSVDGKDLTIPEDVLNKARAGMQDKRAAIQKKIDAFKASRDTGNTSCASMSVKHCLYSKRCVLSQNEQKQYQCRDAANACEIGFVQAGDHFQKSCTDKPGCELQNASCFCPPGVTCACGGGKPAACLAQEQM